MKLTYRSTKLACKFGSIIQAISVMMPSVLFIIFQEDYGVSYAELGTLVLMTFVVQIGVDYFLSKTTHLLNTRSVMMFSCILPIAGYLVMALTPVIFKNHIYFGLILACLLYSGGSGINEVMTSPLTDAMPSDDKGSSMAFLHSFYCWGCLGAVLTVTLLLKLLGRANWQWIPIILMLVPIFDLILFSLSPFPVMVTGHEEDNGKKLLRSGIFWAAMMVMIGSGASEIAMSQWASMFTQKALGINKTWGDILGPCFFSLIMGFGRLFYGFKGDKLNMRKALIISGAMCIVSYAIVIFSPVQALSLVGMGLCGLSVAMMWPGTLVLSAKEMPKGGTQMFALLALGGDIGCSAGPWITGLATDRLAVTDLNTVFQLSSDQFALRGGLLMSIGFPVLLLIFVPILTKERKSE